jgi:hypothetical protein
MLSAYGYCRNVARNGYFYSNDVSDMYCCFEGWNALKRFNLYVPKNSTTFNTVIGSRFSTDSMFGRNNTFTWTNDFATNGYYYNTQYNIYVYPVENVAAARAANGD